MPKTMMDSKDQPQAKWSPLLDRNRISISTSAQTSPPPKCIFTTPPSIDYLSTFLVAQVSDPDSNKSASSGINAVKEIIARYNIGLEHPAPLGGHAENRPQVLITAQLETLACRSWRLPVHDSSVQNIYVLIDVDRNPAEPIVQSGTFMS